MSRTIDHGTYKGWNQHQRQKVPTCDACRAAQRDYVRAYRRSGKDSHWSGCTPGLGWPRGSADNNYSVNLTEGTGKE